MIVLHLISSGGLYGAEAVILNLSRVLNEGGEHRSILGVFDHGPGTPQQLQTAARAENLEVHALPCHGQIDRLLPSRIRALVQRTGADVLHAHGFKADVYAAFALRGKHRRPLVSTCHTWYDNDFAVRLYGVLDRRALRSFDGVVAVSEEVRARLLRAGVRAARIRLIRNGVDLRPFAAASRQHASDMQEEAVQVHDVPQDAVQQGVALPKRSLRVGLVGRLAPEKGIDVFLRAIAHWRQSASSTAPPVQFMVVGEGPERSNLEALRNELGLNELVHFEGHRGDMPAFYASLDVLVSASRQEGLPIALLEGMASGLPLLATRVGDVPKLAQLPQTQLRTAVLVPPNDPAALASALAHFIDDPELRQRLGATGQRLIAEHFSAEAMAADYLDLYNSVHVSAPHEAFVADGHTAQVR